MDYTPQLNAVLPVFKARYTFSPREYERAIDCAADFLSDKGDDLGPVYIALELRDWLLALRDDDDEEYLHTDPSTWLYTDVRAALIDHPHAIQSRAPENDHGFTTILSDKGINLMPLTASQAHRAFSIQNPDNIHATPED